MYPRLQKFSSAYLILHPVYAGLYKSDEPLINEDVYNYIQSAVYNSFRRVVVKHRTTVFEVEPSHKLNPNAIALPDDLLDEEMRVEDLPEVTSLYVAREDHAQELLETQIL